VKPKKKKRTMKLLFENWRQHLKEFSRSPGGSAGHREDAHDAPVEVFVWPIEGNCKVNAEFGQVRPGSKPGHGAIDQNVKPGTPIRAVADGTVTNVQTISLFMKRTNWIIQGLRLGKRVSPDYVGWLKAKKYFKGHTNEVRKTGGGMWKAGVYITIEHKLSDGRILQTQYMHLKSTSVSKGAHVKKGQVIGTSGDTAIIDSNPHLHFVTKINGRRVDPVSIIPGLGKPGC